MFVSERLIASFNDVAMVRESIQKRGGHFGIDKHVTDADSDPDNVILAIAIRDQYSFEMTIPKAKYDPFLLLELVQKGEIQ